MRLLDVGRVDFVISKHEILYAIRRTREKAACGPDRVAAAILKRLPEQALTFLKNVIEESVRSGEVPKVWRQGEIVPIYKGAGKPRFAAKSYRPVTLTSICAKIAERIVLGRMEKWVREDDRQYGYRPGRSCDQQIADAKHQCARNVCSKAASMPESSAR